MTTKQTFSVRGVKFQIANISFTEASTKVKIEETKTIKKISINVNISPSSRYPSRYIVMSLKDAIQKKVVEYVKESINALITQTCGHLAVLLTDRLEASLLESNTTLNETVFRPEIEDRRIVIYSHYNCLDTTIATVASYVYFSLDTGLVKVETQKKNLLSTAMQFPIFSIQLSKDLGSMDTRYRDIGKIIVDVFNEFKGTPYEDIDALSSKPTLIQLKEKIKLGIEKWVRMLPNILEIEAAQIKKVLQNK